MKSTGLDPTKKSPINKKTFIIPDEIRPLKYDELFGEKGIFERLTCVKSNTVDYRLKFKQDGPRYQYSVNYLKPVENKPGEEIIIQQGDRFRLTGSNLSLSFDPLPKSYKLSGFSVVLEIDQRSSGKGLLRTEGFLKDSGYVKGSEIREMYSRMSYPAIGAMKLSEADSNKFSVAKYEDVVGEGVNFEVIGGTANIDKIDFDGKKFTIKLNSKNFPFNCFVDKDHIKVEKREDVITAPVGSVIWLSNLGSTLLPLPEPLRDGGLHVVLKCTRGRWKECYFIFTGREKDGKKEVLVTEPYLSAALVALERVRKEPVEVPAEKVVAEYKGPPVLVPPGCKPKPGTEPEPYTKTGWAKEVVLLKTGIELVFVPAGEFLMGAPKDEPGWGNTPQHKVKLSRPYYIGKYEVTLRQWAEVMGSIPSKLAYDDDEYIAIHPAENVSWNDCKTFLDKLCVVEGVPAGVLRLPTEAEWERACRAGTNTRIYTGPLTIKWDWYAPELDAVAWYGGNSGKPATDTPPSGDLNQQSRPPGTTPHPVGKKLPNAYGGYDFLGNVSEWCSDWDAQNRFMDSTDPIGPKDGMYRVLRGGSWDSKAVDCRSASRSCNDPGFSAETYGIRIAITAVEHTLDKVSVKEEK